MKNIIIILSLIFAAVTSSASDIKLIGRDFWVDDTNLKPIAFDIGSWTDQHAECKLAGILNVSLVNLWDNHLRLGMGFAFSSPNVNDNISKFDFRLITTASTLLFNHLELGFYEAPFYNLYNNHIDDPFGIMIGYAFWF